MKIATFDSGLEIYGILDSSFVYILDVIHVSSVSRWDHENFGCAQIPNQISKTAPRFSFVSTYRNILQLKICCNALQRTVT